MTFDVVVVGAGPAGSALTRALAGRGVRVLVVERGPPGRDKPCGEGLMPAGARALADAGLGALLDGAARFDGIAFHAAGRGARGRFAGGQGRGIRRVPFDCRLADAAVDAGAELRFGCVARAVEPGRTHVVTVDKERLATRVLVCADGARSPLARRLGLAGRDDGRVGLVGHAPARHARRFVDLHFGAGWQLALTPVAGDLVSIAALVEPSRARELAGDPARWLAARLVDAGLDEAAPADVAAIRLGGRVRAALISSDTIGPVLLAGDAAGAVDPIVGCGLSLALVAADPAAAAIAEFLDGRGDRALRRFVAWRRRRARLPHLAAALALALARHPRWAHAAAHAPARAFDALVGAVGG